MNAQAVRDLSFAPMTMSLGLACLATPAQAQSSCCAATEVSSREACTPATQAVCTGLGRSAWMTLGGEYRVRAESLDPVNFGVANAPVSESIAHRGLVSADLRIERRARIYVQVSAAGQSGRKPSVRPFDASDPDLAQAFVEIPLETHNANLALRLGRQELGIGNRLVALRDGVTLRRAFDGVRLDGAYGGHRLTGFYLSPVTNRPDAFDDRRTRGEHFTGLNWQLAGAPATGQWTAFVFNRSRNLARFASVSGAEERQTFGIKYQRQTGPWDITAQGGLQTGRVGPADVLAWGGAVDAGWTTDASSPVRLGVEMGIASGDTDPGNGRLGTFDPLYPNLGAFTDAPLYFYANQMNVQANVSKRLGPVTLSAETTLLARASTRDAIYAANGRPLPLGRDAGRLSALAFGTSARWRVTRNLEIYASVLHAEALDGVRAAGGRDTNFALIQMTTGF